MTKTKLFLVDDQVLFVDMLTDIIKHRTEDIDVIGSVSTGEEAVKVIPLMQPDIVLLDVRMLGMDGLDVLIKLRNIKSDQTVIMLTTFQDIDKAKECMKAGASGFLLKNMSVNDLIDKIRTISKGDVVISSQIAEKIFLNNQEEKKETKQAQLNLTEEEKKILEQLSKREMEVYKLLIQGFSNTEIAEKLFIARQTVKNHIYSIYSKSGYHDRFKIISGKR